MRVKTLLTSAQVRVLRRMATGTPITSKLVPIGEEWLALGDDQHTRRLYFIDGKRIKYDTFRWLYKTNMLNRVGEFPVAMFTISECGLSHLRRLGLRRGITKF